MGETHIVEEERSSGTGGGRWQPPYIGNPAAQEGKFFYLGRGGGSPPS